MLLNKTNQSQMYYHARKAPIIVEKGLFPTRLSSNREKKEKGVIAVLPFPLQASFNFPSGKGKTLKTLSV